MKMASTKGSGTKGSGTKAILPRYQNLFDDLHFTAARQWKAARAGRKVIGLCRRHRGGVMGGVPP